MSIIISGTVYCPLCEKQMARREVMLHAKQATIYFCRPCNIGIYDFDPAFNKWRDADSDIPCPACGYEKIKWFARYMDGYFKGVCPKCKTVLQKDGDVAFKKSGAIIIPEDMEQDNDPPVEIKIPWKHLAKRMGKDKYNALMDKVKRSEARPE